MIDTQHRCGRCHRPIKGSGIYGPKCAKKAEPIPVIAPDLFGFDIEAACEAAMKRVTELIQARVTEAHIATYREFRAAKVARGLRK